MSTSTSESHFDLFPIPTPPPSVFCPARLPGPTPQSTNALRDILRINHDTWDIFFDDVGRHNHISHHAIALWALGANEELIKTSYEKSKVLQRPMRNALGVITEENFNEHLGDRAYYQAYKDFFTEVVKKEGIEAPLERYVFSPEANYTAGEGVRGHPDPEMLNRFLSSILHPMIHAGYGVEFGLPGMMIEALAETAIHQKESSPILPKSFFDAVFHTSNFEGNNSKGSLHSFTIASKILQDPKFIPQTKPNMGTMYSSIMSNPEITSSLVDLVSRWGVDTSDSRDVERKIEELQWLAVVFYAVPGADSDTDEDTEKGGASEFNADFVNMHLVTSSLFLPSLAARLSPKSQVLLLRSYLITILAWWIGNSRPRLDIASFFAQPIPSGDLPSHPPSPTYPISSGASPTGNPWLPLIHHTLTHPDDHYAKLTRALIHYSTLYGSREKGYFGKTATEIELEGAEVLDGTLFLRTAGLTAGRLAETVPTELLVYFDFGGFYGNRR